MSFQLPDISCQLTLNSEFPYRYCCEGFTLRFVIAVCSKPEL